MTVTDLNSWNGPADQSGRTIVVTGATSGLGAAVAHSLASAQAKVILAVRDTVKGEAAAAAMPGRTEVRRLDLADLSSIRRFADGLDTGIDVLINNAGVMGAPRSTSVDGFETHFGVNHLGPFALTGLLLPCIRDRVVTVSSQAHRQGKLDLADPHARARRYEPSAAYAQSKLAALMYAYELQRRLDAAGSHVRSIAAHPGLAQSSLLRDAAPSLRLRITAFMQRRIGQSTEAGAQPMLCAATADLAGGTYVGPDGFYELRGAPRLVDSTAASKDADSARLLWQLSEEETGVAYTRWTALKP